MSKKLLVLFISISIFLSGCAFGPARVDTTNPKTGETTSNEIPSSGNDFLSSVGMFLMLGAVAVAVAKGEKD